jgi:hypothetical protein
MLLLNFKKFYLCDNVKHGAQSGRYLCNAVVARAIHDFIELVLHCLGKFQISLANAAHNVLVLLLDHLVGQPNVVEIVLKHLAIPRRKPEWISSIFSHQRFKE